MQTLTDDKQFYKTIWRCPSNIAIVKYWGKYGNQLPCNSSLSLTLSNSYTEVELKLVQKKSNDAVELTYFFEGEKNEAFTERVKRFLTANNAFFPFLENYAIEIQSSNSFPHSAGIASSASAFGAIALAMNDVNYMFAKREIDTEFFDFASMLARLGSGSASRSMFSDYAIWGENKEIPGTNNEFATAVLNVHPNFLQMNDAILIVEDEPKKVSSSVGHSLMNNHPYAENRFVQATKRTAELVEILRNGDLEQFIQIAESEALTLHAMMMTSHDYYLLMKPGTIAVIEKLLNFRNETKAHVCFTLDAGPNVHILYPEYEKNRVEAFIKNQLSDFYKNIIFDSIGEGPVCITAHQTCE